MKFPVLAFAPDILLPLEDEGAFRRLLAMTSPTAAEENYWDSAFFVDSEGDRFVVSRVDFGTRRRILRRTMELLDYEVAFSGRVSMDQMRELARRQISENLGWDEQTSRELAARIESCSSVSEVCELLMSSQ